MTLYAERFNDHIGNIDPLTVTKAHVVAFRDALERRKDITWKTAQKHLDALHRLYRVAAGENLIEANPVTDVKVRKPEGTKFADEEGRKPFLAALV
jgi:site-specific recombinase XerD